MAKNPPEYSFHAKKLAVEPVAAQDLAELGVSEDDLSSMLPRPCPSPGMLQDAKPDLSPEASDSSQKVTDFKDKAA